MRDTTNPLDIPPTSPAAAAAAVRDLASITRRAGLVRVTRRLIVLAQYVEDLRVQTVDLDALDAELDARLAPPTAADAYGAELRKAIERSPAAAGLRQAATVNGQHDRHFNEDTARTAKVEALIRAQGPQSSSALAKHVDQPRSVLKQALKRLKKQGRILTVGHGKGLKWALPLTTPSGSVAVTADERAKARDAAVLAAVEKAGRMGIEEKYLAAVLPAEPDVTTLPATRLQGCLRRLGLKGAIEFREGRYYVDAA